MDLKRWLRANWDRAAAWLCVALGVLFLFIGWEGVSNAAYPAQQLPYILSGGVGGALLVAMGATLLISADLRDEWQKLDRIEKKLDQVTIPVPASNGSHATSESAEPARDTQPAPDTQPAHDTAIGAQPDDGEEGRQAVEVAARPARRRPLTARRDGN
jgi:hypothetical protein